MKFFMSGEIDRAVDKDFSRIQNEIEPKIKDLESKDYGEVDVDIGIIPIIVQNSLLKEGFFKERRLYRKKSHEADLRLQIDFDEFLNASIEKKRLLMIKNILDSIEYIGKKEKDFRIKELEKDILSVLGVTKAEIESL